MEKKSKNAKIFRFLGSLFTHLLIYGMAIIVLMPFIWMILTSLKDMSDIFVYPPQWLPSKWNFENYLNAFQAAPFGTYYANSLFVAITVTIGQLITCSMAAYAFARLRFRGRDPLFFVFLGTMMIPYNVTMIPSFMVLYWLGWVDTYQALIVPGLASAFGTFPSSPVLHYNSQRIEEAAYIDGASKLQVLWRVIIPLSKPALATLAIFTFMGCLMILYGH
jgi:multiple sugar transport system permease protein